MSGLRRLELYLNYRPDTMYFDTDPPPPASTLPAGTRDWVGPASSLQHLDATRYGHSRDFSIPHLCKFISDTECQFTAVRLEFSRKKLKFHANTPGSQSVDNQPFRIIIFEPVSLEQMGQELSGPLSTVEELIIDWCVDPWVKTPSSTVPRITVDPTQAACPGFGGDVGDEWDFLRQSMINAHHGVIPLTEEAVHRLNEACACENACKIVAWNALLEQDQVEQDELDRVAQEAEDAQHTQREKEAEEQRKEAEKKMPKMTDLRSTQLC
ncbi:hypothetical protein EDB87DRAFT_1830499 [Lactarius vividus]|nr:hypothetical protein EDB87DRAFT_1830499 [Lactarius vividus]